MTSTLRPRRGWAITALRRAIDTLRYLNDELTRANEAIFRPVGASRAGHPSSTTRPSMSAGAGSGATARQPGAAEAGADGAGRAA